ncbi:hypothetical protein BT67DRAFT_438167 [Trichocladium antarcticum]|uniref:Peptidase C45 hydrolase domain-containing protein n=1 Tax=Trichocladium antarcticum TaxID=1450529 RepID=A0AAN6UTC0_9PEZI|nr:hypothetical protein BT67DRAFT_438167 [Trichocladium antarcticum]
MAAGCGESLERLVFLNARDDLAAIAHLFRGGRPVRELMRMAPASVDESISAFFYPRTSPGGGPNVVHSWNSSKYTYDNDLVVYLEIRPDLSDGLPGLFVVTEAGMMAGSGMNSDGLVVASNSLFSDADIIPGRRTGCLPGACLRRYILECCSTLDGVRATCDECPRHTSMNLLVADRSGRAISLELGPDYFFGYCGRPGSSTVLHTNHFQSFDAFQARREINERYHGRGSRARLSQLGHLIAARGPKGIVSGSVKDIFSDHAGSPEEAICQHTDRPDGNMTVSLVTYNVGERIVAVCKGPPCQGHIMHFTFGDGHGDEDSDTAMADGTSTMAVVSPAEESSNGESPENGTQNATKQVRFANQLYPKLVAKKPIDPNTLLTF